MVDMPRHLSPRFTEAIGRFDAENCKDPNIEDGQPRELLYAFRLTEWILKLDPSPSENLLLAARCQHICRWKIPRADYPMTKPGYLKWRTDLKKFHADLSGRILRECGYGDSTVERVQQLNLKSAFPHDPESRTLEDALCLVFLQFQLEDLARKTEREKVINALRKSWAKMTGQARDQAWLLPLSEDCQALLQQALE